MRWAAALLFGACSFHVAGVAGRDGGGGDDDDGGDGGIASPDAGSGCVDTDHDGVCDDVDDCPTVFDPGQVDLDGDGIGFVCDPRETTTISIQGLLPGLRYVFRGPVFAGYIPFQPTSIEERAVLAANPYGFTVARSDSGAPNDAWTLDPGLRGPALFGTDQVAWSRPDDGSDTGILDLAHGVYEPHVSGYIAQQVGALLEIAQLGGFPSSTLYDTTEASFTPLATAESFAGTLVARGDDVYIGATLVPGSSYQLAELVGSDDSYVVRASGLSALTVAQPAGRSEASFCARNAAGDFYIGTYDGAWFGASLAPGACDFAQFVPAPAMGSDAVVVFSQQGIADSAAYVQGGVVTPLFANGSGGSLAIAGDDVQVVSLGVGYQPTPQVWAFNRDRSVVPLTTTLGHAAVSAHGDTINVAGITRAGELVLLRYRQSSGIEQVTLQTGVALDSLPTVATTAEGAAIVGPAPLYIVPSTSLAPSSLPLDQYLLPLASVRGAATTVVARGSDSTVALYAYDEVAGAPRLTELAAMSATPPTYVDLDPTWGSASDRFAFVDGSDACQLATIDSATSPPSLAAAPCGFSRLTTSGDVSASGKLVVQASDATTSALLLLGASGMHELARVPTNPMYEPFQFVRDTRVPTAPIVAWYGNDGTSNYFCRVAPPEACWSISGVVENVTITGATGDPDFAIVDDIWSGEPGNTLTIELVRASGSGDRAPPK